MNLRGEWRNQYGSALAVAEDDGRQFSGSFRTALTDSAFSGLEPQVVGVRSGDAVSFAFAARRDGADVVCAFCGRLEGDRLETVWHVVSTGKPWPHAVATNADTFTRTSKAERRDRLPLQGGIR